MQRNLFKVTANRRQNKIKSELFVDYLAIKHMTLTSTTSLTSKTSELAKVQTLQIIFLQVSEPHLVANILKRGSVS